MDTSGSNRTMAPYRALSFITVPVGYINGTVVYHRPFWTLAEFGLSRCPTERCKPRPTSLPSDGKQVAE